MPDTFEIPKRCKASRERSTPMICSETGIYVHEDHLPYNCKLFLESSFSAGYDFDIVSRSSLSTHLFPGQKPPNISTRTTYREKESLYASSIYMLDAYVQMLLDLINSIQIIMLT